PGRRHARVRRMIRCLVLSVMLVGALVVGGVRPASADLLELAGQYRWNDLSPDQKDRALKNYRKYKSLSPEDRGRVDDGYKRWKGMSDDDKRRIRDRYEKKRKKD
ncbi:MAG: DUF3106 domain-containing protein, partial [Candidatus Binatia bacterium]